VTKKTRAVAWTILIALAAFQAYAQRYVIGPDGVSYLDLSDGVVTGHWSRLINLYWSPAYPVLVGIARKLTHAGPGMEIQLLHAVNVVCFAAMLWTFDYMLMSILSLAARTRDSILGGPLGVTAAYLLFGFCALVMVPLELTTPDMLNAVTAFAAFGAMLRLRGGTPRPVRHAVILGIALGVGALAKSFMVPWAIVCFVTMAVAMRRRVHGERYVALAIGVWLAFVLPWSAVMTRAAGRVTFGDAGRLTYAWYVNMEGAPSAGGVPPDSRRQETERILPGVGVPGDTVGSDPMWFDPVRWNKSVVPHVDVGQQLAKIKILEFIYLQTQPPLQFLFLFVAVAPRGSRRLIWRRGWVVFVPALAAMGAYAMVVVTARYIMAFLLAALLMLLATLPRPRRMHPQLVLLGVLGPIVLEGFQPETLTGLSLIVSIAGGMLTGVLTPSRRRVLWVVAVGVGATIARVVLPSALPDVIRFGALVLAILVWRASYAAVRRHRTIEYSLRAQAAVGLLIAVTLLLRLGLRVDRDVTAMQLAASPQAGNVQLDIARELQSHGIGPGTRVALIGPHAESYWIRTGRMHIVADVPRTLTESFWRLPPAKRDSLLQYFADAGATVAIASIGPENGSPDSTWTPVRYHGWIRPLVRDASMSSRRSEATEGSTFLVAMPAARGGE
jgi:hypothetical protein